MIKINHYMKYIIRYPQVFILHTKLGRNLILFKIFRHLTTVMMTRIEKVLNFT